MVKLSTVIDAGTSPVQIRLQDRTLLLGSCFTSEIGARMKDAGFQVCINPFGALYNPLSIEKAIALLDSGRMFTEADCVQMGAGAGLWCSFFHHTSFARATREEFLENANMELEKARAFWKDCNKVIITLGTAFIWEHSDAETLADGSRPVCNCLKRPAAEFSRRMLSLEQAAAAVQRITEQCMDRDIIFTVSPIRHLGDGAVANQLSKATLVLAVDSVVPGAAYFPAYEIMMDELRDYRFYAEDLVHPSKTAVDIIWERFVSAVDAGETEAIRENERASRRAAHRPLH